jgi:hypothetical protein
LNKVTKNIIICVIVILVVGIAVFGLLKSEQFNLIKDTILSNNSKKIDENSSSVSTNLTNSIPVAVIPEEDTVNMGESTSTQGLTFTVNSATQSKKLKKGFPVPESRNEAEVNKDGTLSEGFSYVYVNMTIHNNENNLHETYLNLFHLSYRDDSGVCDGGEEEAVAYDKVEGFERRDYYRQEFQPNETFKCTIVYIAEDAQLANNENLKLKLNIDGSYPYDEYARCVRLSIVNEGT